MQGLCRAPGFAAALVISISACCRPALALGAGCAPPPEWPAAGATPGHPDAELAMCLKDRAWKAHAVRVPLKSRVAGIIAQCEVEVDRFEHAEPFSFEAGSDEQRAATERWEMRLATAALLAYQPCPDP